MLETFYKRLYKARKKGAMKYLDLSDHQPTFIDIDEDGDFIMTWCYGEQGALDSWRIMFFIAKDTNILSVSKISRNAPDCILYKENAIEKLRELLLEMYPDAEEE